jgi:hypothetical protein
VTMSFVASADPECYRYEMDTLASRLRVVAINLLLTFTSASQHWFISADYIFLTHLSLYDQATAIRTLHYDRMKRKRE